MSKKQVFIGLGLLAIVGLTIYAHKKNQNKPEEKKSNFKTGDRIGNDCYCNGVFAAECCNKKK